MEIERDIIDAGIPNDEFNERIAEIELEVSNKKLKEDFFKTINNESLKRNAICLIEEASEVIKAMTKILRYGVTPTRKVQLIEEMSHVLLMIQVISNKLDITDNDIEYFQLDIMNRYMSSQDD